MTPDKLLEYKLPFAMTVTCIIDCASPEVRHQAEHLARSQSALGNTIVDVATAHPGGKETSTTTGHRLGDYFDKISVVDKHPGELSFELVFHPRPDAGRYWKDLMVYVLNSIVRSAGGVRVRKVSRTP